MHKVLRVQILIFLSHDTKKNTCTLTFFDNWRLKTHLYKLISMVQSHHDLWTLTVVSHALHHDLSLSKLVAKTQFTRHVARRIHVQLVCTQAHLYGSISLLILTPWEGGRPRQVDSVCCLRVEIINVRLYKWSVRMSLAKVKLNQT